MAPRVSPTSVVQPVPGENTFVEYIDFSAPTYVDNVPKTSPSDEVYKPVPPQVSIAII